jgi:hypothetical protein
MRNTSAIRWLVCSLIAVWSLPCATTYGQSNKESDYLLGQGVHAYHSGKYVEAQRHLTAAIEGGSHDPRLYYFRGLCASKLGRTADAEADFLEGSKLEQTFVGRPGEIGRLLQRVQGPTRLALEGYRSRAKTAALQERGLNQPSQIASRPAPQSKFPIAPPQLSTPAKLTPVVPAPAAPEVVKSPKPASPDRPMKPQIAAPAKPAPARAPIVASPKSAPVAKPAPQVAPPATVATTPNKAPVASVPSAPETAPTSKTSKLEPAPSLGFDFGNALNGLSGGNLPGNMAYLRISKRYLDQIVGDEFHEQKPSNDWIMGTLYSGTSDTRGRTRLVLVPNDRQAQIEMHFSGSTNFCTSGRSGPVVLHSRGTTWFESCKLLLIDGSGAHLTPASTCANTCYETDNICTTLPRLLGRISLRVARRREAKGHAQASSIISQNSQREIGGGFDAFMATELAKANKSVTDSMNQLPKDHPFVVHGMHSHTTADAVYVALLGPGASEAKFVAPPMLNKQSPDVELHLHSALIFKGLSDPDVRRMLQPLTESLLGKQPAPSAPANNPPANGKKEFDLYWSPDRSWLTLIWNAPPKATATEPPSPLGKK